MKTLKVPYLSTLDVLDLSSINFVMEEKAYRGFVNIVNWEAYPYLPVVTFDIARGSKDLYLHFFVRSHSVRAENGLDSSPVHQDSCVEFFMKKPGSDTYMNFEFNCLGTCDAARRRSRLEKDSLKSDEYARIRRSSSIKSKPFAEICEVTVWDLTIAIPFELMELDPDNLPEKILGNFYKCGDACMRPHYLSWSPIDLPAPDFHCPEFFGELYF